MSDVSDSVQRDAWRLALGTLTVLPTRPPGTVDQRVAGRAMTLAPITGLLLAALVAVPAGLLVHLDRPVLLVAIGIVAALAWLTRAMHLDGLADVADGLGSGRTGEAAQAVMKKSDIGPFGVATLVLVVLAQVAALSTLLVHGWPGAAIVALSVLGGRTVLPWLCTARFVPARRDGLGVVVAGSTTARQAYAVGAIVAVVAAASLVGVAASDLDLALAGGAGLLIGQVAACALARRCVRRFDGITGDVLGACIEVATTAALVAAALLSPITRLSPISAPRSRRTAGASRRTPPSVPGCRR